MYTDYGISYVKIDSHMKINFTYGIEAFSYMMHYFHYIKWHVRFSFGEKGTHELGLDGFFCQLYIPVL